MITNQGSVNYTDTKFIPGHLKITKLGTGYEVYAQMISRYDDLDGFVRVHCTSDTEALEVMSVLANHIHSHLSVVDDLVDDFKYNADE